MTDTDGMTEGAKAALDDAVGQAATVARDANNNAAVTTLARGGYVANGVLHLLIGWAALGIAWPVPGRGSADQSGAFEGLAHSGWGLVLLWLITVGFAGLALWQLTEAVGGWHGRGGSAVSSRGKNAAKAITYAVLGWTAATFATGGSPDSRAQSRRVTAQVLTAPAGIVLVTLAGAAVIGVGGYHVRKGWTTGFRRDLVQDPGRFAVVAGRIGYAAKGVALVITGGLFALAAIHARPDESTGLDGALRVLADSPYGAITLTVVALGIAAYGVYSFLRARYTRL